jgi:protein gp37
MNYKRADLQTVIDSYDDVQGIHEACLAFPAASIDDYQSMVDNMRETGLLEPIVLTEDGFLLDGRNRLIACYQTGTDPAFKTTSMDPWQYSFSANMTRRHLTIGQKAAAAVPFKKRFEAEAKKRQQQAGGDYRKKAVTPIVAQPLQADLPEAVGMARDQAARMFGIGVKTVDVAVKAERNHKDIFAELQSGTLNPEQAKKEMKLRDAATPDASEKPKATKQTTVEIVTVDGQSKSIDEPKNVVFNRTNDSVDWASWTWNPVTGCEHGCSFCYAREIAHSQRMASVYPFQFEPAFHEYRLKAPANTTKPVSDRPQDSRVFVCSMADLFGKWVPDAWIRKVFDACLESPDWQYLFLTKWPARYSQMPLIDSAWYGSSVIQQSDVKRVENAMLKFDAPDAVKWCSLEPMLEPITFNDLSWCNLMVIGSQTGTTQPTGRVEEFAPKFDWIVDVVNQCREYGVPYYLKANLGMDRPGMQLPKMNPS